MQRDDIVTIFVHVKALEDILNLPKYHIDSIKLTLEQRDCIKDYGLNKLATVFALSKLKTEKTKYGKPFLVSHLDISFNQSHSQYHYALAMSNQCVDVGIDLEDLSRHINMHALALRYFHADEMTVWVNSGNQKSVWLKIWTTKEAVLKAHGLGIRLSLKTLNTCQFNDRLEHPQLGTFRFYHYVSDLFVMSISHRDTEQITQIKWI